MSARPHISPVPNTPVDDIAFINFGKRGCPIRIAETEAESLRGHLSAAVQATASTVRAVSLRQSMSVSTKSKREKAHERASCEIARPHVREAGSDRRSRRTGADIRVAREDVHG